MWYWYVNRMDKEHRVTFMNYGYADDQPPQLSDCDLDNRYPLQLYHYTASQISLEGKKVLEVGCGRGGGAEYLGRCFRPSTLIGLDISQKAVDFCRKKYRDDQYLSFVCGDALDLEQLYSPESIDVVVNVESSHRYTDFPAFANGIYKILSPGGHLLLTDFRKSDEWQQVQEELQEAGLTIIRTEDITSNIVRALDEDSPRRETLIEEMTPRILNNVAREFAGTKGTNLYRSFANGERLYYAMVVQKPA